MQDDTGEDPLKDRYQFRKRSFVPIIKLIIVKC